MNLYFVTSYYAHEIGSAQLLIAASTHQEADRIFRVAEEEMEVEHCDEVQLYRLAPLGDEVEAGVLDWDAYEPMSITTT